MACYEDWIFKDVDVHPNELVSALYKQRRILISKIRELLSEEDFKEFSKEIAIPYLPIWDRVLPNRPKPQ